MSCTRDKLHVRLDPGSCLIGWEAQRDDIMNGDNSGSSWQQGWSKVGNMEDIYPCLSCSRWTCQLLPQHFFNVFMVGCKSWNSFHLVRKRNATLLLHWLWPQ